MARTKTTRQSGKAGDTAAGRGSGATRTRRRKDPFPKRAGDPRATRPTPRPYTLNLVETLDGAMACASWLKEQSHLGVSELGAGKYWGFATEQEGWEMAVRPGTAEQIIRSSLIEALERPDGLTLVMQDARHTVPLLAKWLEREPQDVAGRVVGEVAALCRASGLRHEGTWTWAADDAYDALVTENHYKQDAPVSYTGLCLPRALSPFSQALLPDADGTEWRISYDLLFLRVVAHYTREPALVRAFLDGTDPVPRIGELLNDGAMDPDEAYAVLVWACFGQNATYLREHYPSTYMNLFDSSQALNDWRQAIDRRLSPLSLGISRIRDDYTTLRRVDSLWGRVLKWGEDTPAIYDHRFCGSVRDIVDVVVVALQQTLEDDVSVEEPEYSPTDPTIVLKGRVRKSSERFDQVRFIANLGAQNPLGVPLSPNVVIGG